jgi:hypothetical protein
VAPSGNLPYNFGKEGCQINAITAVANGAGVSSSTTEFEVLVLYTPPAELVTTLTSSSRRWR